MGFKGPFKGIYRDSIRVPLRVPLKGSIGRVEGPWVDRRGFISRVTIAITRIRGLITPLTTTHEPPSRVFWFLSKFLSSPFTVRVPFLTTSTRFLSGAPKRAEGYYSGT